MNNSIIHRFLAGLGRLTRRSSSADQWTKWSALRIKSAEKRLLAALEAATDAKGDVTDSVSDQWNRVELIISLEDMLTAMKFPNRGSAKLTSISSKH